MTCACQVSRISATDARGLSYTAPLRYRCAAHLGEARKRDAAVRDLAAALTRPTPLALPEPRRLLA